MTSLRAENSTNNVCYIANEGIDMLYSKVKNTMVIKTLYNGPAFGNKYLAKYQLILVSSKDGGRSYDVI